MAAPQSEAFKTATEDSKKLITKPSNDELLELYGNSAPQPPSLPLSIIILAELLLLLTQNLAALFKIASGEDISKAPSPGMFDLKASPNTPILPQAPRATLLASSPSSLLFQHLHDSLQSLLDPSLESTSPTL